MKRFATNIILLTIAIAVFYIGGGVVIANFCCTDCNHGIFAVAEEMDCCNHHVEHEEQHCDKHESHFKHVCKTSKVITFDLSSYSFKPQLSSPLVWIAHSFIDACSQCAEDFAQKEQTIFDKAPPITPLRAYLAEIRVLII